MGAFVPSFFSVWFGCKAFVMSMPECNVLSNVLGLISAWSDSGFLHIAIDAKDNDEISKLLRGSDIADMVGALGGLVAAVEIYRVKSGKGNHIDLAAAMFGLGFDGIATLADGAIGKFSPFSLAELKTDRWYFRYIRPQSRRKAC
jgi:hypothetical protein